MLLYTFYPIEEVLKGAEQLSPLEEIELDGLKFQVRRFDHQYAVIERLISTNPQHYLNPKYAPGQVIFMQPSLSSSSS